jgi:SAM-dependent methyltransferase
VAPVALRHRWAVDLIAPKPGERLLEIGCGHGLATGLALATGAEVVAVDRSAKMVAACLKRNAGASGLTGIEGSFETLALAGFDAVFAINVDFVRHPDRGWAKALAAAIKPGGRVVLVLEAPVLRTAERFALAAAASLIGVGFEVDTLLGDGMVAVRGMRLG